MVQLFQTFQLSVKLSQCEQTNTRKSCVKPLSCLYNNLLVFPYEYVKTKSCWSTWVLFSEPSHYRRPSAQDTQNVQSNLISSSFRAFGHVKVNDSDCFFFRPSKRKEALFINSHMVELMWNLAQSFVCCDYDWLLIWCPKHLRLRPVSCEGPTQTAKGVIEFSRKFGVIQS